MSHFEDRKYLKYDVMLQLSIYKFLLYATVESCLSGLPSKKYINEYIYMHLYLLFAV